MRIFEGHDAAAPVHLIGTDALTSSYALALAKHGRSAVRIDGDKAALAGLGFIFRELWMRGT
jgi:2-keto-3-deoxy-galactonokinase